LPAQDRGSSDGLADVGVGTEAVGGVEVCVLFGGGEDDDGDQPGALVGADTADDFEPIDLGKFQVEQDERRLIQVIVALSEKNGEGFGAVADDGYRVENVVFLECPDGEVPVVGVVLDEQDLLVIHEVSFALRVK